MTKHMGAFSFYFLLEFLTLVKFIILRVYPVDPLC